LDEEYSNIEEHYMTSQQEQWQQAETTEDVINITEIWNNTGFQSEHYAETRPRKTTNPVVSEHKI